MTGVAGTAGADGARRQAAAEALEVRRRMREVGEEILARTPEHMPEPSLARVARAMELLGEPQRTYPVIHLTGTNGKSSTTRMIERILRELGLRTGRFTSPHLHDLRERIALDGEPVAPERFLAIWDDVAPVLQVVDEESLAAGGPRTTYFEVLTILAYAVFADAPVDVAVIEVGLGGVWDATNVADGAVGVLAPIALDHTRLLGSTIEQIATEKAGIIKADQITVSALQEPEVAEILTERAQEVQARVVVEGTEFGVLDRDVGVGGQQVSVRGLAGDHRDLFLPLHGGHQVRNLALAIAAVEAFLGGGEQPLDEDVLRAACAAMTSPGRLEIVRRSPTVLVDAAHNPAGALALADALREEFTFTRLVGVLAVLQDKDAEHIVQALAPVLDHVVVSRTTSARAMDPRELGELVAGYLGEDGVSVVPDLPDALDRAAELADESGVGGGVLATGSVITAAEVRMLLGVTEV